MTIQPSRLGLAALRLPVSKLPVLRLAALRLPVLRLVVLLIAGLLLGACVASDTRDKANIDNDDWTSDVIGVNEMQLSTDYWVDRLHKPSEVLASPADISAFEQRAYTTDKHMVDLANYPEVLGAQDIRDQITALSKPFGSDLYNGAGELLDEDGYARYRSNLNLDNIAASTKIRFGMIVERANMRTWPTDNGYFNTLDSKNLDRFQENGLFPADAVAVLHQSLDGEWLFVQSYNYAAWVREEAVAYSDRQTILRYKQAADFLVITGDKVFTSYNPDIEGVSEIQLDMGVRVPLVKRAANDNRTAGQNPYTSYTIELPVRNADGKLQLERALIPRVKDVHVGYLPYTRENITRQAFKFLGERYGWGHSYNARDCTGFIAEVYKTFGYILPRNSGQQGTSVLGENTRFDENSPHQDKLNALTKMDTGDLIYIPGHVLMFVADVDGKPYVIHDVSGLSYFDNNNDLYVGVLNGVSITPLLPLRLSEQKSYIDKMYNIKRIR